MGRGRGRGTVRGRGSCIIGGTIFYASNGCGIIILPFG